MPRQLTDQGIEAEESLDVIFEQMTFKFTMESIELTLLLPVRSPVSFISNHHVYQTVIHIIVAD